MVRVAGQLHSVEARQKSSFGVTAILIDLEIIGVRRVLLVVTMSAICMDSMF